MTQLVISGSEIICRDNEALWCVHFDNATSLYISLTDDLTAIKIESSTGVLEVEEADEDCIYLKPDSRHGV